MTLKDRGSAAYQIFLLGLSVYVLVVLVVESLLVKDPEVARVLQYIDFAVCLVFLGDFFVNLFLAKNRLQYLKWGWIDLISSIPAIDPLRWGRLARVIRILRFLRTIKSAKVLLAALQRSKFQSFTLIVLFIAFVSYSLGASLILEFERESGSDIDTASEALWWAFLNILNAKISIGQAISPEGVIVTLVLNKVGLLLFAYFNAMVIAWMVRQRSSGE